MAVILNEKIDFITIETIKVGSIVKGKQETIHYSCRCSYLDVSGSEFNKAGAVWETIKGSFRVRYCNFTKGLVKNTKKYMIKYNDNLYNIQMVSNYKNLNKWIDIKATLIK